MCSSIVILHWDLGSFSVGLSRDVYITYFIDIRGSDQAPKLKVSIDELKLEKSSSKIQIKDMQ
jgi:hypothetical protein